LQWLQDPSEVNGDNPNNERREASRHFWNKKREYLKDKINELATNSKNKNIRDL
jgi:alpha/beta superfamily hydrolase